MIFPCQLTILWLIFLVFFIMLIDMRKAKGHALHVGTVGYYEVVCVILIRQCLFCCQNADGNDLAGAIVPPVQSLAETK